jgi:hypothetical protein
MQLHSCVKPVEICQNDRCAAEAKGERAKEGDAARWDVDLRWGGGGEEPREEGERLFVPLDHVIDVDHVKIKFDVRVRHVNEAKRTSPRINLRLCDRTPPLNQNEVVRQIVKHLQT